MTHSRRPTPLLCALALLSAHLLLGCASKQATPSHVPTSPDEHASLTRQCEQKQTLDSCLTLANRYRHIMVSTEAVGLVQQLKSAYKLYSRLCRQGHDAGCHGKAELLFGATGVRMDTAQGLRDMNALCEERRHGESCLFLSELYEHNHRIEEHERVSRELLERACTHGSGKACMKLGLARLNAMKKKDFEDERLLTYSEKACSDDDANTCALLDLVNYHNTTKEKRSALQDRILKRCFRQGYGAYCPVLISILHQEEPEHFDTPAGHRNLAKAYQFGCAAHDPHSCKRVAHMLSQEPYRLTISREHARAMLSMACEAGIKEACVIPFEYKGKSEEELAPLVKINRHLTEIGCSRGSRVSCHWHASYTYVLFDVGNSEVTKEQVIQAWEVLLDMHSPQERGELYEALVQQMRTRHEALIRELLAPRCHKGDDAPACEHVKAFW